LPNRTEKNIPVQISGFISFTKESAFMKEARQFRQKRVHLHLLL